MALRVDNYLDETDRENKFERTKVMDLIDIAESSNKKLMINLKTISNQNMIINEKNEEINYLRGQLKTKTNEIVEIKVINKKHKSELEKNKNKSSNEIKNLKRKIVELNNEIRISEKKLSSLDRKITTLQDENEEQKKKIYVLDDTINVNEEEISNLNITIEKINESHEDFNRNYNNLLKYKEIMDNSWFGGKWIYIYNLFML